MKYRKKPVVIEAMQLQNTEISIINVLRFMGQKVDLKTSMDHCRFEDYCNLVRDKGVTIRTLEGNMTANVGDFIIKGVNGEFYPCKPDIFEKTYEPAIVNSESRKLAEIGSYLALGMTQGLNNCSSHETITDNEAMGKIVEAF